LDACILFSFFLNDCFKVEKEQMMEKTSDESEEDIKTANFLDTVLSWPLEDVLNENLYKDKVFFYSFCYSHNVKVYLFLENYLNHTTRVV
jgi:hypothetical protein